MVHQFLSSEKWGVTEAQTGGGVELSVIIVNWNSTEFLRKCLVTLFAHHWNPAWEVVVVDNASYDGCEEMLAADFPGVRFLQITENSGFAAANNFAFNQCTGRHILFLNPDTEIMGPAIGTMLGFLRATPDAGAVGVRLLNTDLSLQTSCIQRFPTILNQILDCDILRRAFPRASLWGMAPVFGHQGGEAQVDAISGACLMVTREAFEQAGRFNVAYFMYSEDVDLCFKLRASGRRNYYLGAEAVIHHGGKSTASHETGFSAVIMRESRHRFLRQYRGTIYAALYRVSMAGVAVMRLLLGTLYGISLGRFRRPDLRAAQVRWYKVLRWALGLEAWAGKLRRSIPIPSQGVGLPQPVASSLEAVASNRPTQR